MKKLLTFAFVALMAGAAFGQPCFGVFFSNESFEDADTNVDAPTSVNAYLVVLGLDEDSIGAYECGLEILPEGAVFVTGVTGANGWTNYSTNLNQRAGYTTALPVTDGAAVLSTLAIFSTDSAAEVTIGVGPTTPSSLNPAAPNIVPGRDDSIIIPGSTTAGPLAAAGDAFTVVATFNGAGVVATEAQSLSNIKAMFD